MGRFYFLGDLEIPQPYTLCIRASEERRTSCKVSLLVFRDRLSRAAVCI